MVRRRSRQSWCRPTKATVTVTWDNLTNAAYKVQFTNIGQHWSKCEVIIMMIKNIPTSQRDYDAETKTWLVGEMFIENILKACRSITDFDVVYTEKPSEQPTSRLYNKEVDYAEFKRMLSFAHVPFEDTSDFKVAKRAYLKAAMKLHPDVAPEMAPQMSTLNEVWARLQRTYFKQQEVM